MAVANTKTTAISNADANPSVTNPHYAEKANDYNTPFQVAVLAADDDGSVYRIARLPSSAVLLAIPTVNTAITGGTSYNLGFYQTTQNGGAIVGSGNQIATAVDMSAARGATGPLDLRFEAAAVTTAGQRIWEILGLTADPGIEYDLAFTAATVGTGAGTIGGYVSYIA